MNLFYLSFFIGIFVVGETNALCEEKIKPQKKFLLMIERDDYSFDDEETKRYFFCSKYEKGTTNEKGLIIESKVLASEEESSQIQRRRFLDNCNKESGESKEETTWNIFKCFQNQVEEENYPPGFKDEMNCVNKTGVSKKLTWKLHHFDISGEDESYKKFIYCIFQQNLNDDGSFTKNDLKYHECNKGKLITDYESMWTLWKCLMQPFQLNRLSI